MRIIDVSAAAGIGLISVAALVVWSPVPYLQGSAQYARQASLEDYLTSIVLRQGMPWFQTAAPSAICFTLAGYGNSTLIVGAKVAGLQCAASPESSIFFSNLELTVGNRSLVLEAWQVAEQ